MLPIYKAFRNHDLPDDPKIAKQLFIDTLLKKGPHCFNLNQETTLAMALGLHVDFLNEHLSYSEIGRQLGFTGTVAREHIGNAIQLIKANDVARNDPDDIYNLPLEIPILYALKRARIFTLEELKTALARDTLRSIKAIGKTKLAEIIKAIEIYTQGVN